MYTNIYWDDEECDVITHKNNQTKFEDTSFHVIDKLKELESRMNRTVTFVHNCQSCGATLEVEENKQVIHCKYCGGTYLVGTLQINSHY